MPAIAFDDWSGGLDLRKAVSMSAANVLAVMRNCYVTTGKAIRKRPCLNLVANLEAGTVGLKAAGGKLNTFYGVGAVSHVNPLFLANKVAHPTVAQDVVKCHFGENFNGFLYAAVEYADASVKHHYLDGTAPTHIVDVNCPNTKIVAKMRQKMYAAQGGNVRYCKTSFPRDWTTASDAGFIPASNEAAGSDTVTAIGDFRGDLAIFFADSAQLWDIDADPALNAIKDTADNVGTLHHGAAHPFANDLVFLAASGFRSLALTVITDNLEESDIGSPIDELREEIADLDDPQAIYYPRLSQLWVVNGTRAYVITYSKKAKITAWGIYDFPFTLDALAVLNKELYVRSGNSVYIADRNVFTDAGIAPLCEVEMFYQDNKAPGVLKHFTGFDCVIKGAPQIAFGYDPREPTLQTEFIELSGGGLIPAPPPYLSLPDSFGNYVSQPDSLANSVTGEIDIRVLCAAVDWGEQQHLVAKRSAGVSSYDFAINANDTLSLHVGFATYNSSVAPGFAPGSTHWIRVTRAPSGETKFYTSDDATTWTQLGDTLTGSAGALNDTSVPLEIGSWNSGVGNGTPDNFLGKIFRAQVLDGIDGTIVADFDPAAADVEERWTIHTNGTPAAQIKLDMVPVTDANQQIRVDTRPGDMLPMELVATSIAPCFKHQRDEEFEIDQLICHYENLGPV